VRSCPACGGSSPLQAQWCGQCCAPFDEPVGAVATLTRPLPAAAPPMLPTVPDDSGRMLSGRALVLTVVAIGVGVVASVVLWWLSRDPALEPESFIRYSLVGTIGVYGVVGALIVTQLAPGIRLRWTVRSPAVSVLIGAGIGGGLAATFVAISRSDGNPSPDGRISPLMSEGDFAHIAVTLLILCICAPVIEEVLFRGLLLESFRGGRAIGAGLVGSAVAFSVWHLNPSWWACGYYVVMGLMLGGVYLRRGLAGSIATHFAFNGILAMAALASVLSPAQTVSAGNVSVQAPTGWSAAAQQGSSLALNGPSGAALLVLELPLSGSPSVDEMTQRIRSGTIDEMPGVRVDTETTRAINLPAGSAAAVDVSAAGHDGTLVLVPFRDVVVEVVFLDGGSAKARADFPGMLRSVRVG
jgi:membrane protease YdiL (CAAX protease family)